jgi:hypothetical protein
MQITSQQHPEHRMRLPQDSRSANRGLDICVRISLSLWHASVARPCADGRMFHIKCPEKIFFKDIEVFPDTQKFYISP